MHNNFCVVITRPKEDAIKTAKILDNYQIKSFIEPVLEISFKQDDKTKSKIANINNQVILTTSANAIRALKEISSRRDFKIVTVGKATQQIAKDIGFINVEFGGNDVDDLEKFVIKNYEHDALIYLSSNIVTKDLKQNLQNKNFKISQLEVYASEHVDNFSDEYLKKLRNNEFNAILLYSLRSAKSFLNLTQKNNLQEYIRDINIFCLSENIYKYLVTYGLENGIFKSENPTNESLIKLLQDFISNEE